MYAVTESPTAISFCSGTEYIYGGTESCVNAEYPACDGYETAEAGQGFDVGMPCRPMTISTPAGLADVCYRSQPFCKIVKQCADVDGYTEECSDCATAEGVCRFYITGGWDGDRTCSSWCEKRGLTCHAMHDDRNNQCCNHKDQTDGDCDYTGNAGDMDYICECWLGPVPPTPEPTTSEPSVEPTIAPTYDCTDGVEGYSNECSADCPLTTPGTCRYYISNGDWGEERTCSYWCGSQGLTCHAMYDDSGNNCCNYKGNKLSCDYTGDASDKDFICECWP